MSELNPQGRSPLRGDLGLYFMANILPMGSSVAGMIWVLRLMPPAEFGIFNLVSATASIAATGAFQWLCQWILRFGAQFVAPETRSAHWTVLWRGAAVASALLALIALFVTAFRPGLAAMVGATLLLCLTLAAQSILITVLQGSVRAQSYTIVLSVSTLLRWICTILLCYLWKGSTSLWWTLLWGQLIGQVAATALALGALRGNVSFRLFGPKQRPLELQALFYGAPFLVWAVSMQLLNVADRYVIQGFAGAQQVGAYSAIYNLSSASVMVLTNPVLLAFTPRIFQHAGAAGHLISNGDVRRLTENCLQLLWIIGAPLVVWSALLHREFVTLVLGSQYAQAALVFPIVIGGILLWQLAQILQKGFETAAKTSALGSSIVSAVFVNLLLNFAMVPRWGVVGAALATVGAYAWYAGLIFVRVVKYGRPQIAPRSMMNVILATSLSSAVLVLSSRLGAHLWMRVGACTVCLGLYSAVLLLLREKTLTVPFREVQRVLGAR
jgi:O-antigen/teichoic acid export membrane protein